MEWISILKCPITGADFRELSSSEITALNEKISKGQLWQADGKVFSTEISQGLITSNGDYIYPILREVVLLLKDLALVDSKDKLLKDTISADKQLVKNFYDEINTQVLCTGG